MLTPQELLEIVDTMQPLLDELNGWIVRDMIDRIMARLGRGESFLLTGTDQWQLEVYKAAGGHFDALQKKIQTFTKKSEDEIKAIFEDAGVRAWEADNAFYVAQGMQSVKLAQSERMVQILTDTYQRTNGEIKNFTRTTAAASQQRFIQVLDDAHFKVSTGAQSYTQAVKDAVEEIAGTQTKVHYPTGHTDTIETAVLRAVRTGVAQASGNMSIQGMVERDWDLIRVSAHLGARYGDGGENPGNHFWWQGKLYSRTGKSTEYHDFVQSTGYGTGIGLCGWNCRHSFGPGDPNHNPYAGFDAEENRKAYDLSQKQRAMERKIRRQKTKLLGLRQAVDSAQDDTVKTELQNEYDIEAVKLGRYNAQYNQFCEANDLKRLSDRISVAKWTRSEAGRAAQEAKNHTKNLNYIKNDAILKAESDLPKKRTDLPDEILQHTVNISLEATSKLPKMESVVPKGTTLTNVYVMAGDGTSTPIRDLKRLYTSYRLPAKDWQKKSGTVLGKHFSYTIHWYENRGHVPIEEIKLKGVGRTK